MRQAVIGLTASLILMAAAGGAARAADPMAGMTGMGGAGAPAMAGPPTSIATWAEGAMRFDGLAKVHRPIVTTSPQAQAYFDQGLALMWGFNHDEATRSFAKAVELDPHCAACLWGVSLTVGPNYNLPFMTAERAKVAFEALKRAQAEASHASPVEQALIEALARRYPDDHAQDPGAAAPVLAAYAEAMKAVAHGFPDDLDVQTLYAESLMNLHAWKLWGSDGTPAPGTLEIVDTLKDVLARDPQHVGANHYLIHALEASPHPEEAVAAAERLRTAAPAEGHLDHMPAHIFQRVGRYEDAAEANRRGAAADLAYVSLTRPPDYYAAGYTSHNYQFLAYSAAMEGRQAEAVEAADRARALATDDMMAQMAGMDWYASELYSVRVRFGLWDQLLAMPAPNAKLPGVTIGYLWGRGMAQAAKGQVAEAKASLAALEAAGRALAPDTGAGQNVLVDIVAVATPNLRARIARAERRQNEEIAFLRQAVAAEDRLAYDEPKNWFAPSRHALGEALLRAGRPAEAQAVYSDDLKQNPANGWALFGLAKALRAQGRKAEAAAAERAFGKAWSHADITLAASAF
jgi:tetratricopeptide (TPR) repeat protein